MKAYPRTWFLAYQSAPIYVYAVLQIDERPKSHNVLVAPNMPIHQQKQK